MYGIGNIVRKVKSALGLGTDDNNLGKLPPMVSSSGNAFDIDYVPISNIYTDEKNFQNRADKYSEKSVNSIINAVNNDAFNWFAFDPVTLWLNPEDGRYYVLSGHSRTQAFRQLAAQKPRPVVDGFSFDRIPAKIFKGSFEDAKYLALNSNTLGTPETLTERADYYRTQRAISDKSELKNLKKKALRENNGQLIWDLSYLPANGMTMQSLKSFKVDGQDSMENFVRLATIAQWIGKAFQIYRGLSSAHDQELLKFLLNGGYGSRSGQYFSFSALNDRLEKLYKKNVADEKSVNTKGEFTKPFQIAAYQKSDSDLDEINELKKASDKALKELKASLKNLRENNADRETIYRVATPYFNGWVNAQYDWWQMLDRVPVRDESPSLFGLGKLPTSQLFDVARITSPRMKEIADYVASNFTSDENPTDNDVKIRINNIFDWETLPHPEDGDYDLLVLLPDYIKTTQPGNTQPANTQPVVAAQPVPAAVKAKSKKTTKREIRWKEVQWNRWTHNQISWCKFIQKIRPLITPENLMSDSFTVIIINDYTNQQEHFDNIASALDYAFEHGFLWNRSFMLINDKESLLLASEELDKDKKYIQSLSGINGLGKPTIKLEFESNEDLADFLKDNKKTATYASYTDVTANAPKANTSGKSSVRQNFLMPGTGVNMFPESVAPSLPPTKTPPQLPTSPTSTAKALPPYVEPTSIQSGESPEVETPEVTAESVTEDEIESANITPVTLDWDDFEKRFAKASNWSSFDPERSARFHINGYKEAYEKYVSQVPAQYRNSFDWFVKRYINDLIAKRSRTASSAVTGPGGIDAKKAASLNRANDSFQEASANLPYTLAKYVHKINLREKRKAFVNSSMDERYAQRIKELTEDVRSLKFTKDTIAQLSKGAEIPQDFYRKYWYYLNDRYGGEAKFRDNVISKLNYDFNLDKATFKDKLTREVTKGNVEIVDAVIDYLKPLGLFTNRAEIWTFPEWARRKRQTFETATQQAAEAAADENSHYRIEYDTQEDRVKIIFNGMPSAQAREWLKKNGFRWSPRNKAWQRQITDNARRAVEQFKASGLGKPTIKLEFEDNSDLMSLFDTDGISGMTVNDKPADVFNCPESQLQCRGFVPTYERLTNYDHLVAPATGNKTLVGYGFDKATLDELVAACRNYSQVEGLAKHLQGDTPLQSAFNIWHWLHCNVRYDSDAPGEEEIRTPARCYADRDKGVDCDCLAVMTACLLICMGYQPKFEIVGFGKDGTYSHIFVNLDGAAIDRVLPVFLQRPDGITKTKIMDIPVYRLNGCNVGEVRALSGVYADALQRIADGTATADDSVNFRKTQVLVTLQGADPWAYRLGAILMPYVAAIGDDGTYYFTNADIASLASQSDAELRDMIANGMSDQDINKWLANVIVKLNNAAIPNAMSLPGANADAQIVVIINPRREAVTVEGDMFKADMVKCNALAVSMLKNLQMLFAVNFLNMATRYAVGLLSADDAAALGYGFDAHNIAVAAINRLTGFYNALGGNVDYVLEAIKTGSSKKPLTEYTVNMMLVELSDTDATINGIATAIEGINGLCGAVTIGSAVNSIGDYFPIIMQWIEGVTPSAAIAQTTSPTAATDDDLFWYIMAGFGSAATVGALAGNKKKRK